MTYILLLNCALKLVEEIILFFTCFEQIIFHHQEVISVQAAYNDCVSS